MLTSIHLLTGASDLTSSSQRIENHVDFIHPLVQTCFCLFTLRHIATASCCTMLISTLFTSASPLKKSHDRAQLSSPQPCGAAVVTVISGIITMSDSILFTHSHVTHRYYKHIDECSWYNEHLPSFQHKYSRSASEGTSTVQPSSCQLRLFFSKTHIPT